MNPYRIAKKLSSCKDSDCLGTTGLSGQPDICKRCNDLHWVKVRKTYSREDDYNDSIK